jgi:hypothetical protein
MRRPLCFNLGRKMLLITSLDSFPPPALFKLTDEDFAEFTSKKDLYMIDIFRGINGFMFRTAQITILQGEITIFLLVDA